MNRFEYVVYDGIDPCVYLKEERARTPFRWQSQVLQPEEVDIVLSLGDRRYGEICIEPIVHHVEHANLFGCPYNIFDALNHKERYGTAIKISE